MKKNRANDVKTNEAKTDKTTERRAENTGSAAAKKASAKNTAAKAEDGKSATVKATDGKTTTAKTTDEYSAVVKTAGATETEVEVEKTETNGDNKAYVKKKYKSMLEEYRAEKERAEKEEGRKLPINEDARTFLKEIADGDGRYILNLAESIWSYAKEGEIFDKDAVMNIVRSRAPVYDKGRDGHYNLISAVHKSLRGSDVDAALYWVARMLSSGEDPRYVLRRLVRFAIEDVSLADPNAVVEAIACAETYERLGSPEGDLAVMQLAAYLATAPKSAAQPIKPPTALANAAPLTVPKTTLANAALKMKPISAANAAPRLAKMPQAKICVAPARTPAATL